MVTKTIKTLVICFIILVFLIAVFSYFGLIDTNIKKQSNTINNNVVLDNEAKEILENREVGKTGEITIVNEETQKEVSLANPNFPTIITSTVGKILNIQANTLTMQGTGNNFADERPREITGLITDKTIIFNASQKQYNSADGVKILKQGLNVLIEGEGNIRGKTEFNILTLNILSY